MSAGVITDTVEGSITRDSSGWRAVRSFFVELAAGGDPTSAPYRAATTTGIPAYGDPHPAVPSITASSVTTQHSEGDPLQYIVTVEYGGDESGVVPGAENTGIKAIDVSTSTVTIQTLRDYAGDLMTYTYTGPEFLLQFNSIEPPTTNRFVESINAEPAEVDIPTSIVTVTITRNRPSHVRSRAVAGTTNDGAWSGLASRTWLCLGIDSSITESGKYDWRYVLAVAPKIPGNPTWRFRSEIIRNNSWVRRDATIGNGIAFFDVYRPVNFTSELGFEIPS